MSSDSFPVMADICTSMDPPAYAWEQAINHGGVREVYTINDFQV